MQLELDSQQYKDLATLVFLGNFLINAFREGEEKIGRLEQLQQYFFTYAKQAGFDKYLAVNDQDGQFLLNQKFQDEVPLEKYIEEFVDEIFWEELINRLTTREMMKKFGEDKLENMAPDEFEKKRAPFVDKYSREFEENGLENLKI